MPEMFSSSTLDAVFTFTLACDGETDESGVGTVSACEGAKVVTAPADVVTENRPVSAG